MEYTGTMVYGWKLYFVMSETIRAYDHGNFLQTADWHWGDCQCLRCRIDIIRNIQKKFVPST